MHWLAGWIFGRLADRMPAVVEDTAVAPSAAVFGHAAGVLTAAEQVDVLGKAAGVMAADQVDELGEAAGALSAEQVDKTGHAPRVLSAKQNDQPKDIADKVSRACADLEQRREQDQDTRNTQVNKKYS